MKKINLLLISLIAAFGCVLASCSDDDKGGVAEAVIASTRSISFPVNGGSPVLISVVSDGDWHVDAPEWLNVTPSTGTVGTTDVTITATANERGGAVDLPRKCVLQFMGTSKRSIFEVKISQDGDKFRDIQPSTIAQMEALDEEAAVMFNNLSVYGATTKGFVGTDGTDFVYVTGDAAQARTGQKVSMLGTKMISDQNLAYVECDQLTDAAEGTVPQMTPKDITDDIDSYKSKKRELITATGIYNGSKLVIDGKTMGVLAEDTPEGSNLAALAGHIVTLTGIYSGTASPVVRMIVTDIEDKGANETIYFLSEFDVLFARFADWQGTGANEGKNIDAMGCDNENNYLPNIGTPKVDGVSPLDLLKEKGYIINGGGDMTGKGTGCNFQKFYLKMGSGSKENSCTLPKIDGLGEGTTGVKLSFDWSPWRDKAPADMKAYDPTQIVVIVHEGGVDTPFPVETPSLAAGESLRWHPVEIDLGSLTLTKDTRIEIRNIDDQFLPNGSISGNYRWFLNNIKVSKPQ